MWLLDLNISSPSSEDCQAISNSFTGTYYTSVCVSVWVCETVMYNLAWCWRQFDIVLMRRNHRLSQDLEQCLFACVHFYVMCVCGLCVYICMNMTEYLSLVIPSSPHLLFFPCSTFCLASLNFCHFRLTQTVSTLKFEIPSINSQLYILVHYFMKKCLFHCGREVIYLVLCLQNWTLSVWVTSHGNILIIKQPAKEFTLKYSRIKALVCTMHRVTWSKLT